MLATMTKDTDRDVKFFATKAIGSETSNGAREAQHGEAAACQQRAAGHVMATCGFSYWSAGQVRRPARGLCWSHPWGGSAGARTPEMVSGNMRAGQPAR